MERCKKIIKTFQSIRLQLRMENLFLSCPFFNNKMIVYTE
jgi:hypothetical protein